MVFPIVLGAHNQSQFVAFERVYSELSQERLSLKG